MNTILEKYKLKNEHRRNIKPKVYFDIEPINKNLPSKKVSFLDG